MKTPTHSSPAEASPAEIRERDVSLDALLGGRVRLLQPKGGLRAA
ncbi:MAG: hypothetical protein K0Q70_1522, partial [Rhodospirillales bacterium]|nr:hypothetical protein [Rhodospirillales bacterium]